MGDALAELGVGGITIAEMDRIGVAREIGEKRDVALHDGAHQAFALADDQILEYTWTDLTGSWVLIRSSSLKKQEARYTLTPAGNKTKVKFEITVDPVVPIPGFLLKRSVSGGAETATEGLKKFMAKNKKG